jgi:hypothetical protein
MNYKIDYIHLISLEIEGFGLGAVEQSKFNLKSL